MKKITLLAVMLICFISTSLSYAVDYYTIPTAAINIDGNFDDWDGIPTAIQDLTNDVYNASYIDIDKIYLAQDQDYFYFRIDVIGNLENTQFSCQDWLDFRVEVKSQNNNYGIYMDIDPSGQNTGKVRIWDYNLQTSLIQYPASAGFGALSGNIIEYKILKSHLKISMNNQKINGHSWENCTGAGDDTTAIYIQDSGTSTYWYEDSDSDGYGNPQNKSTASSQPAGYVTDNTDCNDNDASINPGADETCGDGIDQDCNGPDAICTIPTATINIDGNFNDWNGIPIAIQDLTNDVYKISYVDIDKVYLAQDQDHFYFRIDVVENLENAQFPCSDWLNLQVDVKSQNYNYLYGIRMNIDPSGNQTGQVTIEDHNLQTNLMQYPASAGFSALSGNMVEYKILKNNFNFTMNNKQISGSTYENCIGVNDDTASIYIQDVPGGGTNNYWYEDFDNDGYGSPQNKSTASSQPAGYISDNTDCNDNDASINPGANDICGDGIDQDCSGSDETCPFKTDPTLLNVSKHNTADFDIIGGSGFYNVVSNDESVASVVTIKNNIVRVTGKSEGTTTITVTDSSGENTSVKINVTQIVKAVIVAGSGPYATNYLWDSTLACTKYAYKALYSQGYTNDTIAYYTDGTFSDVNGDGINDVDGNADNSSLKAAITSWAGDAKDVLIYMTGHGSDGKFKMGEYEHLDASVLNGWLKTLESKITGKVTFVYDACQSGSFVSSLVPEPGTTRIMLFSASKGENAYFTSLGAVSFSNMFWTQIHNGADIKDAFVVAKNAIEYSYTKQTPILDDNGNGIGNDDQDGVNTQNEFFGNGIVSAGDLPSIASISPSKVLKTDISATIYADNVTDIDGISEVWAVITPPDSYTNDPDTPVLSLPALTLDPVGKNRYEAVYTDFTKKGNYNIAVFAKDINGNVSIPKSTSFIQSKGESYAMLNSALTMTMPSVEFQGTCYQITLDNYAIPSDGVNFFWKLDTNSIGKIQDCGSDCALMDNDFTIAVPKIEYNGSFYQINLQEYKNPADPFGNYWKLDLNSVKPF